MEQTEQNATDKIIDKNQDIQSSQLTKDTPEQKKPVKPPKPEDKPFEQFINEELIPSFTKELESRGIFINEMSLLEQMRPVVGGTCSCLFANIDNGRRIWLCFCQKKITSIKSICLSERGSEPSLIESFLIDEKKTTLSLLISRLLQRLNGQKWLEAN